MIAKTDETRGKSVGTGKGRKTTELYRTKNVGVSSSGKRVTLSKLPVNQITQVFGLIKVFRTIDFERQREALDDFGY